MRYGTTRVALLPPQSDRNVRSSGLVAEPVNHLRAALRGMKVIVPVDGLSNVDAFAEQFSIWPLGERADVGQKGHADQS